MMHDEHCYVAILWPGFDFNHFSVRNDMIGKEQQLTSGHPCEVESLLMSLSVTALALMLN